MLVWMTISRKALTENSSTSRLTGSSYQGKNYHWKKKRIHFVLKVWVTGRTKIGVIGEYLSQIESQYRANLTQIESQYRANLTQIVSNYSESQVKI